MNKIDIFITAFHRVEQTRQTLAYLRSRTTSSYRIFLIDQAETNKELSIFADFYIGLKQNVGIHCAWNIALAMAESEYFITSDNDIYVPDLGHDGNGDWLERMVKFMDERPNYGAISMHPHVFIGAAGIDPNTRENVVERNMCGAVMRIMRRNAVHEAGGWEHKIEAGRNHEERTICTRLQEVGYKVGIASRVRAFHPFPPNWGYPADFSPEMQKHNPALEQEVQRFGNMDSYDSRTWLPK